MNRRPSFRTAAAATCAAALVLASGAGVLAYTGAFDFSGIYNLIFGRDSESVRQYIEPVIGNAEDAPDTTAENTAAGNTTAAPRRYVTESVSDGVSIRLVSVLHGADDLRIFAEATDLTGNRIDGDTVFDDWGFSRGHGGNISVVEYDEATKTAALMITSLGENEPGEATININGYTNGKTFREGAAEGDLDVYSLLQTHAPGLLPSERLWENGGNFRKSGGASQRQAGKELAENTGLLTPDEMRLGFDNIDWAVISNIGFVDGRLHIQTKTAPAPECRNDLASINFVNRYGEVVYDGHLFIGFTDTKDEGEGSERRLETVAQYKEMIYEGVTDVEQLKGLTVTIDYLREGAVTKGEWKFAFRIPEKSTADINAFDDVVIGGKTMKPDKISVSPLGVTFNLPENIARGYSRKDTLRVIYETGETVTLSPTTVNGYNRTSAVVFGGQIIDPVRVQSIELNGEAIEVAPGNPKNAEN
jgi:hypothetical protein